MPDVIQESARNIDLSPRFVRSVTVAGSPAAAVETTIATLTLPQSLALGAGVLLMGWAAYTVGTNGTAVNLRIRRTDTSGAIQCATGATNATAANLDAKSVGGFDTGPTDPQVYVLTMTVTAGTAVSTVSGVLLWALAL